MENYPRFSPARVQSNGTFPKVNMPIHDWTRVDAGIFHDFHATWIPEIKRTLNAGLLPDGYYALAEQAAGGIIPDVLTLHRPEDEASPSPTSGGAIALATLPPRVQFHLQADPENYAARATAVVIRHKSHHQVIALVEVVSPGNKGSKHALRAFVEKADAALRAGIHLLIIDLFPPGPRDPQGIHKAIWDQVCTSEFAIPADRPLTLAAYIGGPAPEAFLEPTAVGTPLADMPVFLTPEEYVPLPLEATYQKAWEAVPAFWREVLDRGGNAVPRRVDPAPRGRGVTAGVRRLARRAGRSARRVHSFAVRTGATRRVRSTPRGLRKPGEHPAFDA
jgi:hypothetical protein